MSVAYFFSLMTSREQTLAKPEEGVREPGIKVTLRRRSGQAKKRKSVKTFVTKDWTVGEIVEKYPQATEVMAEYGLHCFGCAFNALESLEEGCLGHGFTEEDIADMVSDINEHIRETPLKPQKLHLTKGAALAIREVAKNDSSLKVAAKYGLSVQANSDGSFYMEFREAPDLGEKVFKHPDVADVSIYASTLTLQRIGGATIDFRDGKFKLDMVDAQCCKGTQ